MIELSKEAKEIRNKYQKEWRKKNADKVKASQVRYWEKQAAAQKIESN